MIKPANEAVRESALTPTLKSRGAYAKYKFVQQATINKYASMYGNLAAVGQHLALKAKISHCMVMSRIA